MNITCVEISDIRNRIVCLYNSMAAVPDLDPYDHTSYEQLGKKLAEYNALLKELFTGNQRYKAIVESSDDAILSKDLNGIITSWNKGAQRVFGYTEAEAVGRHIKILIPPELHSEEDNILRRLRQGQRIDHYVTKRMRKDGSLVDISLTISPVMDEHGQIVGASKVARDIGAHLRESALRNRLSAIVESSDDAIISKDLSGIITSWNKGAEHIFGYTAEEMIGTSILRLIPPHLHEEEAGILRKLRRGERIDHFQTVRVRKDGSFVDISITVSPVKNDRDEIIGASKVARDITSQKQAMDRLRESEEKFITIFNSSPVGMVLAEAGSFKVIETNPAFARLMDMSAEQLKGEPVWGDHRLLEPEAWASLKRDLTRDHTAVDREIALEVQDDARMDLLVNATMVKISGQQAVLLHVENITERKSAYRALEESDRRKDEFIATLSHELRNPLAPISNALHLLELAPNDPQMVEQSRSMMNRQLKHMVRLLDDLMDLSRVSRGVIQLRKTPLELGSILQQSIETSKPLIDGAGHDLKLHLAEQPLWVYGDHTRLVQIFSNLLNNAAKYTPSGGTITVTSGRSQDRVTISIRDNGIGIDPHRLEQVFDMFSQMEPAITRTQSGLGIGLSIVKQLVMMHGGTITAFSEGKGQGSRFTVELPIMERAEGPKDAIS